MGSEETESLWGEIPSGANIDRTPLTLLKEQASLLGKATNNLLVGDVSSSSASSDQQFRADFFIVAPTLNEYRYHVLHITYPLGFYPVTIKDEGAVGPRKTVQNEEELKAIVAKILKSRNVRDVVQRLINHIKVGEGVEQ